tara:strand:+ start:1483 stop:2493 length:1011 start_codon:yes stop_codon:yes gene_type:complete
MSDIENDDQNDDQSGAKIETPEVETVESGTITAYEENTETASFNTTDSVGVVQSVGHLLRNARLSRSMSIEDVSRQLRLSVQQIDAIEKEDYENLPGHTFVRGFVRNYANLVQLDPAPMLQLLPRSSPVVSVQRTPFKIKEIALLSNRYQGGNRFVILAVALILLVFIIYGIYLSSDWGQNGLEINETQTMLETDVKSNQTTVELQLPLPPTSSTDKLSDISSSQSLGSTQFKNKELSSPDSPSKTMANTMPTGSASGTLHFLFTAESWVEVRDATGKKVFSQINPSGTERVVSGKRPLSLVIGNAAAVNLTYNDRFIDIKPYTNVDEGVARFTLE